MTAVGPALVLAGAGLALWPAPDVDGARLRRLGAAGRLGPVSHRSVPARAVPVAALLVALAAVVAALAGPALGVAAAAAGVVVAVPVRRARAAAVSARHDHALELALTVLRTELDAGADLAPALAAARERAGPASGRLDPAGATPFAAAAGVVASTGVPWTPVLTGLARDAAAAGARRREVAAVLAGVRASVAVLAGLPAVGLVMAAGLGAHPVAFLTATPAGRAVLATGAVLEAVGTLWTDRLTARAAR